MTKFNNKMTDSELIEYLQQFNDLDLMTWFQEWGGDEYEVISVEELEGDSGLIDFKLMYELVERQRLSDIDGNLLDYDFICFSTYYNDTSASDKFYDLFAIDEWRDWLMTSDTATAELDSLAD